VDSQVATVVYDTPSEQLRELIRHEQERDQLRSLLLQGAHSEFSGFANDDYFDCLRSRIKSQ
jgi:antitoxin ParD1/3/4